MNVFMFGFTDLRQNINCRITDEFVALSGSIPRDVSISVYILSNTPGYK